MPELMAQTMKFLARQLSNMQMLQIMASPARSSLWAALFTRAYIEQPSLEAAAIPVSFKEAESQAGRGMKNS